MYDSLRSEYQEESVLDCPLMRVFLSVAMAEYAVLLAMDAKAVCA